MITAWRIVKAKHAVQAFDGEGARLRGGRWNPPGAPMVYTAGSASLAALEMLAHLSKGAALTAYLLISCTFDERLVSRLDRSRLPSHWRAYPAPPELQVIGDQWLKHGGSAVLEVPSVLIDTESNYLLSPTHPDFGAIAIAVPRPFELDLRLLGR